MLAAAVPFLFLHATYQPSVSVGARVDDGRRHAGRRRDRLRRCGGASEARREGWQPLLRARWLLPRHAGLRAAWEPSRSRRRRSSARSTPSRRTRSASPSSRGTRRSSPQRFSSSGRRGKRYPLLRALVAWSVAATGWGLLQFLGVVSEFEGKRPGQREPSFVGIHDFAALSGAALVVGAVGVALGDGRPVGRRWSLAALATGALGVVLSGAMTAVIGLWLAVAAVLLGARAVRALRARRARSCSSR